MDSCKERESKTPVIQIVSPRTIPGILTPNNKGAIDWGWQSFVAYGCHNHIIVIDTQNLKIFQTLEKHKGEVLKVKWAKESCYHDLSNPYTLRLASADNMGNVIIWDVKKAKHTSVFSEGSKPVAEMEWLSGKDACQNLLVALQPPYSVIVWNTETGTKIWKKSYTEVLISFAFDPFTENNMTFLASNCILFVDDFNTSKSPSSNGRKFYISNPSTMGSHQSANPTVNNFGGDDRLKSSSKSILPRRMRFLVNADSKTSDDGVTLNECLQLSYHRSYRHHLLLLYPREVLILDLEINQTVGIVSIEHNGSPMMQLHSCWQRDVFYILHESGSVSFRLRHRGHGMEAATPSEAGDMGLNPNDSNLEVAYDLHCQSDALRLTKHAKVTGLSVCPVSESKVALLVSDGRLLFLDLIVTYKKYVPNCLPPYLLGLIEPLNCSKSETENISEKTSSLPLPSLALHPANVLSDNIGPALYSLLQWYKNVRDEVKFKMFITGTMSVLAAPPHVIRMCPPVTFRNWTMYRPFMAVGNAGGSIQVINMATGVIEKEFSVHTSPVRGIEWIGLTSFMSFAHPNTVSNLGQVRNELVITDIQSGRTKSLRLDKNDESPVEMLRVSYSRQYVIVIFKEEPLELWDLKSLTLLKVMPKNFPSVSALEWCPRHIKRIQSSQDLTLSKMKDKHLLSFQQSTDCEWTSKPFTYTKEKFIFTDANGQLYNFAVEGNIVTDGHPVPADVAMGSTTCIAWKGSYIILGDVDGNLVVYNEEGNCSKAIPTHRGWIKKIRFGPGKGNTKILVLYNDGVDLWDVKDVIIIHQIRCPREMPKVQDIDWVSPDLPALATSDGCVRITDIALKLSTSPLQDYQPCENPFSPHILSPKVGLYVKSYLHHQLWKEKFNSDIDQQGDLDMSLAENQLKSLDPCIKRFLKDCPFGTAERCLHVARIYGDEESCRFWTVALHFLKEAKVKLIKSNYTDVSCSSAESNLTTDDITQEEQKIKYFFDQPLDTGYDVFCDNETYKKLQLDRVSLHVNKRAAHSQTQQCVDHLLLLGQTDKAVQLLLETESDNANFFVDSLRACLIATVQSSGTSQSIIKLVSTNLIVNEHILEGVQLLCLIHKGVDACRYLQGSNHWDKAVWLAKATLPQNECQEILKRWVDQLCTPAMSQKNKGLLVLLSMHQFWKVIQMLQAFQMTERAALFLQACMEFDFVQKNQENSSVIDSIFLEYSKYLLTIKNRSLAIHFCKLASETDNQQMEEQVTGKSS